MAIRKRTYKDGSTRYMVDFYDQKGVRQRETLPGGTTYKDAKEKLRGYEIAADKGVYVPDAERLFFGMVAADWVLYKKDKVRFSTWSVLDGHIRNHLQDFEGIKIDKVSVARIEKWISAKREDGMNVVTLRKVLVTLGQIFKYAFRHKYVAVNPMLALEAVTAPSTTKPEMVVLKPEQIRSLLDATTSQKYKMLFRLAVFSGCRQGELLGLKWPDVLWESNQIAVNRTFNNGRFYDPKTAGSRRRVDLGPDTMLELKRWQIACPPNEMELVFPNDAGNPINHNNMVNRAFIPALKAAGLPVIRFHALRHTYASLKIRQGANIKYIQEQMGHSKPTITLNVYAHLFDASNAESAQGLEKIIFEK
ncbi:MAG: tyrosine-type recombinase/integrase [Desulfobacterales bacterium]|jgi:integrase|nr:tyrosine-type recombinase/integrase [Desulfobacterales bacterium]